MFATEPRVDGNHVTAAHLLARSLRVVNAVPNIVLAENEPMTRVAERLIRDLRSPTPKTRIASGVAAAPALVDPAFDMRWQDSAVYIRKGQESLKTYSGPLLVNGLTKSDGSEVSTRFYPAKAHEILTRIAALFPHFRFRVDPTSLPKVHGHYFSIDVYLEPLPEVSVSPTTLESLSSLAVSRPKVIGEEVMVLSRQQLSQAIDNGAFRESHKDRACQILNDYCIDPAELMYGIRISSYIEPFAADLASAGLSSDGLAVGLKRALEGDVNALRKNRAWETFRR